MKLTNQIIALLFAALAFFSACSPTPQSPIPNLILINGNFFAADSLRPEATAVAIHCDRILAGKVIAKVERTATQLVMRHPVRLV